jgi:hypothetical protein
MQWPSKDPSSYRGGAPPKTPQAIREASLQHWRGIGTVCAGLALLAGLLCGLDGALLEGSYAVAIAVMCLGIAAWHHRLLRREFPKGQTTSEGGQS